MIPLRGLMFCYSVLGYNNRIPTEFIGIDINIGNKFNSYGILKWYENKRKSSRDLIIHVQKKEYDYTENYAPRVATITAFIVCILFSASSKTIELSKSNTSLVTSRLLIQYLRNMSLPIIVSRLWKAGKQCINFTLLFPVKLSALLLTWYRFKTFIRSSQTPAGSLIDIPTSVYRKSVL